MEVKHTPGPWKAHRTGLARSGKPEFEIHWSDLGECVAEVVHGEPDARLIAAAPDLLEELTNLLLWAEEVHKKGPHASLNYAGMDDARVAIKKATGVWHE